MDVSAEAGSEEGRLGSGGEGGEHCRGLQSGGAQSEGARWGTTGNRVLEGSELPPPCWGTRAQPGEPPWGRQLGPRAPGRARAPLLPGPSSLLPASSPSRF